MLEQPLTENRKSICEFLLVCVTCLHTKSSPSRASRDCSLSDLPQEEATELASGLPRSYDEFSKAAAHFVRRCRTQTATYASGCSMASSAGRTVGQGSRDDGRREGTVIHSLVRTMIQHQGEINDRLERLGIMPQETSSR
jgi:hypothetical protein